MAGGTLSGGLLEARDGGRRSSGERAGIVLHSVSQHAIAASVLAADAE
jgi:hypothetical protein